MFLDSVSRRPQVLVIGGANLDLRGRPTTPLILATSNPGLTRRQPGGVGRNIAENLARLGARVRLLSAIGDDEPGKYLIATTAAVGVDTSGVLVREGEATAIYLAILDEKGVLLAAISDMRVLESLTPEYLRGHKKAIQDSDLIIVDANPTAEAIATAVHLASQVGVPIAAISVSQPKAPRLRPHLASFSFLFCQEDEAELLSEKRISNDDPALAAAQDLVRKGVGLAVVTRGKKGVAYATPQETGHIPALAAQVVDETGAGDALAAATLFGALSGLPTKDALRLGLVAAALTVQTENTVSPELSISRLQGMIANS